MRVSAWWTLKVTQSVADCVTLNFCTQCLSLLVLVYNQTYDSSHKSDCVLSDWVETKRKTGSFDSVQLTEAANMFVSVVEETCFEFHHIS